MFSSSINPLNFLSPSIILKLCFKKPTTKMISIFLQKTSNIIINAAFPWNQLKTPTCTITRSITWTTTTTSTSRENYLLRTEVTFGEGFMYYKRRISVRGFSLTLMSSTSLVKKVSTWQYISTGSTTFFKLHNYLK